MEWTPISNSLLAAFWMDLEYMSWLKAALIYAILAAPIVILGVRSMAGLGRAKKWVTIGIRLCVVALLVLILGGARWQRQHKVVEVLVLRDISDSTRLYRTYPGRSLQESVDDFLTQASKPQHKVRKDDRIGVISFSSMPLIDAIPYPTLMLDARAIRERGEATDIASAIQLGLATFQRDAMRRMLLVSDGLQTAGDIETALAAAASQKVPIDVMKLSFAVQSEVLIERVIAPAWRREIDAFEVAVSMLSTHLEPVRGKLTLTEAGQPLESRPRQIVVSPATLNADGKIEPRKHIERFRVPPLRSSGVRRFKAVFEPDVLAGNDNAKGAAGDTLVANNSGSAFTFVRGQGRVLYVDGTRDGAGMTLMRALEAQGINVERRAVEQTPDDLVALQAFDCVILNNVPRVRSAGGATGVSEAHDPLLASYVHNFGGGLIMIGGEDSMGAGGWQGSKVEEIMPVSFDVPAERQISKGALVLLIHACEMPRGDYWGEQCAIKAMETLSRHDEVGIVSYGGGKDDINGVGWDLPLSLKGDGRRATAAIKKMKPEDMPAFDDCLKLAWRGVGNQHTLKKSDARQKHIIIISDGDPRVTDWTIVEELRANKVTVSTVTVYPHGGQIDSTMRDIADATGGKAYGPIDSNPDQLPQIFIKEATTIRRSLIQESREPPLVVAANPTLSDVMKGVAEPPDVFGVVLSHRKNNPTIQMPLEVVFNGKRDPLFAHWQAGLGRAAVFASDAGGKWSPGWASARWSANYGKFWGQLVRAMSRPPMSQDVSVTTERRGDRAVVRVEATDPNASFANFLNITGTVVDPQGGQQEIRLVQVGPGTYTAEFPTNREGSYVIALRYSGPNNAQGMVVSGVSVNDSPEMRELKSNDLLLEQIARRTGGRVIQPWDAQAANLFSRENVPRSGSPLPVWDILIPILLGLVLVDVAARRIAWDWESTKKLAAATANYIRSWTLSHKVESKPTLDALKKVREEVAETKLKPQETLRETVALPASDPKVKFEAKAAVEGDLSKVVGGATDRPIPSAPEEPKPRGAVGAGGYTGSLLEAKKRAQQKIREKEQGDQ